MKLLRYNENIRNMMKPKSNEEIREAIQESIDKIFKELSAKDHINTSMDWFDPNIKKYIQKYILIDNILKGDITILLYEGKLYRMEIIPGGQYYTTIYKLNETVDTLKNKLKEILNKL